MRSRVAINGLGRIGRAVLKLVLEQPSLELVAINDLADAENLAYLLRYDTVYGRLGRDVHAKDGHLIIGKRAIPLSRVGDAQELPWRVLAVDLVFECTGALTRRDDLEKHLHAGARMVILSAPSKDAEVETVIHGSNTRQPDAAIISCASCTTNCITPVIEVLGRRLGLQKAIMTTVHAYTSSQSIVDGPHKDVRRGRAAAANLIPTTTGAARATMRALPEYAGRFDGIAIRAPVVVGSIADITCVTARRTTVEEVNQILAEEAETDRYDGVLGVSHDPLVSADVIGDSRASIVDLSCTMVVAGDLVKVMSWYDNEWGYANQMVREALTVAARPEAAVLL
jgi:glyceraldehyde 3-phosphate dehydrogenase